MTLTQEQIKKISQNLSKIKLNDENFEKSSADILNYMELLQQVDTTGVASTVSVTDIKNTLRDDVEVEKTISRRELLDCSNQKVVADQIAVSNIMQ